MTLLLLQISHHLWPVSPFPCSHLVRSINSTNRTEYNLTFYLDEESNAVKRVSEDHIESGYSSHHSLSDQSSEASPERADSPSVSEPAPIRVSAISAHIPVSPPSSLPRPKIWSLAEMTTSSDEEEELNVNWADVEVNLFIKATTVLSSHSISIACDNLKYSKCTFADLVYFTNYFDIILLSGNWFIRILITRSSCTICE